MRRARKLWLSNHCQVALHQGREHLLLEDGDRNSINIWGSGMPRARRPGRVTTVRQGDTECLKMGIAAAN